MDLGIKLCAIDIGTEFGAIDPGAEPALQVGPFPFSLPSFPFPLFLSSLSPDASRRRRRSRRTSRRGGDGWGVAGLGHRRRVEVIAPAAKVDA